jgi:hypothetical protein
MDRAYVRSTFASNFNRKVASQRHTSAAAFSGITYLFLLRPRNARHKSVGFAFLDWSENEREAQRQWPIND